MKIAYTIYGVFNSGGMERVLCNKANWLVENGYDVYIITTDQQNRPAFFEFDERVKHIDLGVHFAGTNGKSILIKTLAYFVKQLRYKKRLLQVARQERFDVIVSMFGAEVHWLPRLKDSSRKIVEIHFSKFFREQQARGGLWWLSDIYRSRQDEKAIKRYDKFVILSDEDKQYWGDQNNMTVIPNAVSFLSPTRSDLKSKVAIAVGRLTYQKGFDMLIEAWKRVQERHHDWRLRIIGDGPDRNALALLSEGLNIELCGTSTEIQERLSEASIYILSSRYEGLPMVLLEAMGCGVPPVAFQCKCGPKDIIDNDVDGILIEEGIIAALAEGICRLIENPELLETMGKNAHEKVARQFNEQTIMAQWDALFKTMAR